jgi:putative hydrolase
MERIQQMDLSDPQRLQEAMGDEGLFGLVDSPATQRSLDRIHGLLALLEAYADRAVAAAAVRLPSANAIAEAARRRVAEGGKGLRLFQRFIGLEVPLGRRRDAEVFTGTVLSAGGWDGLNRLWDETENLPTAEEIAAPEAWLRRVGKG